MNSWPSAGHLQLIVLALFACTVAIFAMKLFTPLFISHFQKTSPLTNPELIALAHKHLRQAGLPQLQMELWPLKKDQSANAMVAGLVYAPQRFKARIFVSDSVLEDFQADEWDAILAHEIAHLKLNHLSKRIWVPFSAYAFTLLSGSALLTKLYDPAKLFTLILLLTLASALYILCFSVLLRILIQAQEQDADWVAIHEFGIDQTLYVETLDKMANYGLSSPVKPTAPRSFEHEERRKNAMEAFAATSPPFEKAILNSLGLPLMVTLLALFLANAVLKPRQVQTSREPAAASSHK